MSELVEELNSLDFGVYIGGPLQAAVQAQQASSMAAVEFIREVGFETDSNGDPTEIRYVDFDLNDNILDILFDFQELNIQIVRYFLLEFHFHQNLTQEYYQVLNTFFVDQNHNQPNNHHTTDILLKKNHHQKMRIHKNYCHSVVELQ